LWGKCGERESPVIRSLIAGLPLVILIGGWVKKKKPAFAALITVFVFISASGSKLPLRHKNKA